LSPLFERARLAFDGDSVTSVQIHWGEEDRPLWKVLQNLPLHAAVKWCDRFSPFEAVAAEWAFAECFEAMFGLAVPDRAQDLRSVYAEVQRLLWSFEYCGNLFRALGDDIRYQQFSRLREQVLEGQEILTGARVLPQIFCIGGVERDLSVGEKKKLKNLIRNLEYEMRLFFKDLPGDQFIMGRLSGLMVLSERTSRILSVLGAFGQASGVAHDLRLDSPYGSYPRASVQIFDPERTVDWFDRATLLPVKGDGLNRLRSVFFQIRQSLNIIDGILDQLRESPVRLELGEAPPVQPGFWIKGVEGGSGPLYCMIGGGNIRFFSHSMRMVKVIEGLLTGCRADDFELAFASLGVDFAQADLCGN
jgi:Ni,Fe-hydrogenase III large subunit